MSLRLEGGNKSSCPGCYTKTFQKIGTQIDYEWHLPFGQCTMTTSRTSIWTSNLENQNLEYMYFEYICKLSYQVS